MKAAARIYEPEPQEPTPETFLEEIHRIFESGTLRGAREVAERGLALFPDHEKLRRLHHALRPAEVKVISGPDAQRCRVPDRKESFEWLRQNWGKYPRQWVAVLGSELIAASPKLAEVLKIIEERHLDAPPVLHFFD